MKRAFLCSLALGFLAFCSVPAVAADRVAPVKTIDAFVTALKANKDLPAEKVDTAIKAAEELKTDATAASAAITVALREVYEDYATALVELADENLEGAVPKLEKLAKSEDPYLSTDATFFLARAYMLTERFEEALPLLDKVRKEKSQYSTQQADTSFLVGLCQARLIMRKEAIDTFTKFESEFPDAPERMRIGAWRMLQQLQLLSDGTIIDVQDRMEFSRRKLVLQDPGKKTQDEQKKIVDILAKLIKEAEEKECNCQGGGQGEGKGREKSGGQGNGSGAGQGQGGNTGGQGQGSSNSQNTDATTRLRASGKDSGWSKLREREREQVITMLKQKYPDRYEKLIEQYYKSFENAK